MFKVSFYKAKLCQDPEWEFMGRELHELDAVVTKLLLPRGPTDYERLHFWFASGGDTGYLAIECGKESPVTGQPCEALRAERRAENPANPKWVVDFDVAVNDEWPSSSAVDSFDEDEDTVGSLIAEWLETNQPPAVSCKAMAPTRCFSCACPIPQGASVTEFAQWGEGEMVYPRMCAVCEREQEASDIWYDDGETTPMDRLMGATSYGVWDDADHLRAILNDLKADYPAGSPDRAVVEWWETNYAQYLGGEK